MATLFDITLLGGAKVVFTFLLVYVVVWGLLVMIKPFGKSVGNGAYAIIGLVSAFFSIISGTMRYVIEFMTPWFLFLVLFLFFTLFVIRMFGVSDGQLSSIIKTAPVYVPILSAVFIILLFALGSAFGQQSLEATQGAQTSVSYNPAGYPPTSGGDSGTTGTGTAGTGTTTAGVLQPGQDLNGVSGTGQPQPGQAGATATNSFSLNVVNTLLNPKVMALIAIILIATITVWLMARPDFI